jgi:hypothetical protein
MGALAVALVAGLILVVSGHGGSPAFATVDAGRRQPEGFGWLVPRRPPSGWAESELPSGGATLAYPPPFVSVAGDQGTVSAAVLDRDGRFVAYLNVTPRQGREQRHGFAWFRVRVLSEEHDTAVAAERANEGIVFRGGRGSCVVDHYTTRIGHHRYREISCLVVGRRHASVIVAAATTDRWKKFRPLLHEVLAAFTVS